jgi:hypothetical protein
LTVSATDWFVVAGALAAIGWVNWYFFLADRGAPAAKGGRPSRDDTDAD